jgi:hypothetical protein
VTKHRWWMIIYWQIQTPLIQCPSTIAKHEKGCVWCSIIPRISIWWLLWVLNSTNHICLKNDTIPCSWIDWKWVHQYFFISTFDHCLVWMKYNALCWKRSRVLIWWIFTFFNLKNIMLTHTKDFGETISLIVHILNLVKIKPPIFHNNFSKITKI